MNEARVIALGGLFQAVNLVRSLATEGDCDPGELETCMASVFKLESESVADVYGGLANVREGLRVLVAQIDGSPRDPVLLRIVFAILRLERSLHRHPAVVEALQGDLQGMQRQLVHFGPAHPTVLARAADLYAENLSGLRPRVMVIGNHARARHAHAHDVGRRLSISSVRGKCAHARVLRHDSACTASAGRSG